MKAVNLKNDSVHLVTKEGDKLVPVCPPVKATATRYPPQFEPVADDVPLTCRACKPIDARRRHTQPVIETQTCQACRRPEQQCQRAREPEHGDTFWVCVDQAGCLAHGGE